MAWKCIISNKRNVAWVAILSSLWGKQITNTISLTLHPLKKNQLPLKKKKLKTAPKTSNFHSMIMNQQTILDFSTGNHKYTNIPALPVKSFNVDLT
jgi:hypothetical protein